MLGRIGSPLSPCVPLNWTESFVIYFSFDSKRLEWCFKIFLGDFHIISYLFFAFFISFDIWPHLVVCLTTGPKPLSKRAPHIVRSRASSVKWEYPLLSLTLILLTWKIGWAPNNASKWQMGFNLAFKGLRSSSSFLRLLPRLPVTSIPPFIFPSVTCCRRQFLRKMWPIQFAFR